ncbi:MAG: 1-acyl-sn-glycerol-3-phosphate acyltransferase [Myxococcota bacterium]
MKRTPGAWVHGFLGWGNYLFWTVTVGVFIALGALNPTDRLRRFGGAALSWCWGRFMWWTTPFWWRRWEGLEHLADGPFIIVANHQSTIDIPCLFGLPLPLKVSARPGIFRVPVMGRFLSLSGQVDTDRFFEQSVEALDAGISIVVFPEGSRSADGSVQRFHSGAFKLAVQTGRPILPVAMDGAQEIMSKRAYFPTALVANVKIRVLPPLVPGDDAKALSQEARQRIVDALADLRKAA